MPRFQRLLFLCASLLSLGFLHHQSLAADADGFTSLFNGKDLSGWVGVNVAPDTFTVKDGLIVCTGLPTGVMRSEKMYENFIVELEWRHLRPGGNSGFFVWADAITSKGVPFARAIEVQVLDGKNGPENSYTTHGDIFPIHGATMKPDHPGKFGGRSYPIEMRSNPSPEWNHYRIECNNGSITLAVNGKVVNSGREASPRKGYLCLESEGGLVHFRNLKIKELPASAKLEEKEVAEAAKGFISLYTGLNLDGWKTESPDAWRPKDWTLQYRPGESKTDLTLWTSKSYKDFELIVDCKTKSAFDVVLHGKSFITIPPADADKDPTWRRITIRAKGDKPELLIDDSPAGALRQIQTGEGPIGIKPAGQGDFANFYIRPIND